MPQWERNHVPAQETPETRAGEGNGSPLQYSCLEKSIDRGARRAAGPWAYMTEHVAIKNFKKKREEMRA